MVSEIKQVSSMTEEEASKIVLESKKIKVEGIFRDRGFFNKDHDGNLLFSMCFIQYSLPYSIKTRSFVNPFISNNKVKEQEAFEVLLGEEKGALNLNSRHKKSFWRTFYFKMDKEGLVLDLTKVMDALIYRVLRVQFEVTEDARLVDDIRYKFLITDLEKANVAKIDIYKKKREAYKILDKIGNKKEKLIQVLRMLGEKYDETTNIDILTGALNNIIEQAPSYKSGNIKTIDDFLGVVKDKDLDDKLFVLKCIDKGYISKNMDNNYILESNGTLIGTTFNDTVSFFKNAKNIEIKQLLEAKIMQ